MRGLAARATNVNEIRLSDLVLSGSNEYFKYMLGAVVGTLVGEKSEQGGKRRRKSESEKVCSLFMPILHSVHLMPHLLTLSRSSRRGGFGITSTTCNTYCISSSLFCTLQLTHTLLL